MQPNVIDTVEAVMGGDAHIIGLTGWVTGPGRKDQVCLSLSLSLCVSLSVALSVSLSLSVSEPLHHAGAAP